MAATFTLLLVLMSQAGEPPKSLDDRLVIEPFATQPQIVTPTGIAVDGKGRVLVIECHTHFRPDDYDGPLTDRIRVFEDSDGDGKADRIHTFFEGTSFTMNLAVHADGSVYVATRSEVFRLRDLDDDGRAEEKTTLVTLDTPGNYPHNGLSGFAFDFSGNVYFGFGENLGAEYKLVGADGVTLSGGGEGGNIYRCQADGTGLRQVATGFWNPFHVATDVFGNLFTVDNDPDSRPPCRLIHVVDKGDYGYRFRNGRKGVHPFTAWNGELPGTLPMIAGTGEAPSGMVVYGSDQLPSDYRGTILSTSWGDHRIEKFKLQRSGASFRSEMVPVIQGGENFRPVGIAVAPDGSLYVSDWVDRSYPLHKKGSIWHIRAKDLSAKPRPSSQADAIVHADRQVREHAARTLAEQGNVAILRGAFLGSEDEQVRATALSGLIKIPNVDPELLRQALNDSSESIRVMAVRQLPSSLVPFAQVAANDASTAVRAAALGRVDRVTDLPVVLESLTSDDPFVTLAARTALKGLVDENDLVSYCQSPDSKRRLAALLLLRENPTPKGQSVLPRLLKDPDPTIRQAAVQWVAESSLKQYRPDLLQGMAVGTTTRELFESYLAALERLDGKTRAGGEEIAGEQYVAEMAFDEQLPGPLRERALRVLRPDHPAATLDRLKKLLGSEEPGIPFEAVRTLRERPEEARLPILAELAKNPQLSSLLRAEAIVGLPATQPKIKELLFRLALEPDPLVRDEALRSLRTVSLVGGEHKLLETLAARSPETKQSVEMILDPKAPKGTPEPSDTPTWVKLLREPGDAQSGERLFFHPNGPGCYRCHQMNGRGGNAGPELSTTANKLTHERLIDSILLPSKEIAPQFTTWALEMADGSIRSGILLGELDQGRQSYADNQGKLFEVPAADIVSRQPMKQSVMPDKLHEAMTVQEFRDLLAYLGNKD